MTMRPETYYKPPASEDLVPYLRPEVVPPLDHLKIGMVLLVGDQRKSLKTPITGDMSLVLAYKRREGCLVSFADNGDELGIIQFQGAVRGNGYRVATGIKIVELFASQIQAIANHPESPYRQLYMPPTFMIEGVEMAVSDLVRMRYEAVASELGMKFSHYEQLFLKQLR